MTRSKTIYWMLLSVLALAPAAALAQQTTQPKKEEAQKQTEAPAAKPEAEQKQAEDPQTKSDDESKLQSVQGGKALGMSILGNQEAPKALVIVPWKTSELGNGPSVSTLLDDSKQPIDKEVFMRMLSYYEIRSEAAPTGAAPASGNAAAPVTAAPRRKP
jgi:hypothetical protein